MLDKRELEVILNRFPAFELSYETALYNNNNNKQCFASQDNNFVKQNKILEKYDTCIAVPAGRKYYAWFTFYENNNVCYLMELDRKRNICISKIKKIANIAISDANNQFHPSLSLGTIVYGTICDKTDLDTIGLGSKWFIIEDIIMYHGITMNRTKMMMNERLGFTKLFLENVKYCGSSPDDVYLFGLPLICQTPQFLGYRDTLYSIHHIQYRSSNEIKPYMNVDLGTYVKIMDHCSRSKSNSEIMKSAHDYVKPEGTNYIYRAIFSKPQYKMKTVFVVKADPQYDVYNLFAYGKNSQLVFYNIAYIPNYRVSVFMNSLFRNIKENRNLDYIEESDDEEDFQNIDEYKYVDLEKQINMECMFHMKFKKWVPIRVVDPRTSIVHIHRL